MKKCSKCGVKKDFGEFYKCVGNKYGLQSRCKGCYKDEAHKDQINAWREDHREEIRVYRKAYHENYRDKSNAHSRAYHGAHKAEARAYRKAHKEARSIYDKNRRRIDIQYKISCYLRSRLRHALKNNQKSGSAVRDLGCTITELVINLEKQFKPDMTWENYGIWHIDHIRPLSSFDLTNRDHLLQACHFTNLQPLWGIENMAKGNRISTP